MKRRLSSLLVVLALAGLDASISQSAPAKSSDSSGFLPGAGSKEPVSIDADKLVYLDKEQRAIYTGNVIVIQGATRFTCSELTLTLLKTETPDAGAKVDPTAAAAAKGDSPSVSTGTTQVNHMDAVGPVTITSKTQVATSDKASYDKPAHKFWLNGNVTMSDSGNVTKGDQMVYDLVSWQAIVTKGASSSRIHAIFTPGAAQGDATPSKGK